MSHTTTQRMPLAQAVTIAEEVCQALAPFCARLDVAGSIRRQQPTIGDIEIVCMPRQVPGGLFGDELAVDPEFCTVVNRWPAVKGKPTGKYTQRVLPSGVTLDLFMADPENFGAILLIRTGDEQFSKHFMGWVLPSWSVRESCPRIWTCNSAKRAKRLTDLTWGVSGIRRDARMWHSVPR